MRINSYNYYVNGYNLNTLFSEYRNVLKKEGVEEVQSRVNQNTDMHKTVMIDLSQAYYDSYAIKNDLMKVLNMTKAELEKSMDEGNIVGVNLDIRA